MPDFSIRSSEIEIMDDLDCSGEVVNQTLRELEFINTWLGGNAVTLAGIEKLLKLKPTTAVITIADLGCGGGDMLRLVHGWAEKKGISVKLVGFDANPHIIEFARESLKDLSAVELLSVDIFSEEFRLQKFDIVLGTLFYHHFENAQLIKFFNQLRTQVRLGFVMNDIHRHPLAYYSIKLLTAVFSKSAMVKYDAPLSVMRAFKAKDILQILAQASISHFTLRWRWAFRWQVVVFHEA
jgi:2-polyprenyl-3-methyl-5-hydroxy-6-metoxy-1,4-benzoquinol methylase